MPNDFPLSADDANGEAVAPVAIIDAARACDALVLMDDRIRAVGLECFDPTDVDCHPLFAFFRRPGLRWARYGLRVSELYLPLLWRRALGIQRELVPTALYHLGCTYLACEALGFPEALCAPQRSDEMCRRAQAIAIDDEFLFEHPYSVHAAQWRGSAQRSAQIPESCAHHAARLGKLMLMTGLAHAVPEFVSAAEAAAAGLVKHHVWHHYGDGTSTISYYPSTDDAVINTAAEVAVLLCALGATRGGDRYMDLGRRLLATILEEQSPRGGWAYATRAHGARLGGAGAPDIHHNAMILGALAELVQMNAVEEPQRSRVLDQIELGVRFHLESFHRGGGQCRMAPNGRRPADIAGYCESVKALLIVAQLDEFKGWRVAKETLKGVSEMLEYALSRYLDVDTGEVASRRLLGKTYNVGSIRWGSGLLMDAVSSALVWPSINRTLHRAGSTRGRRSRED